MSRLLVVEDERKLLRSLVRGLEAEGHDVIMLSIGDPDFETPVGIVDAAVAGLRAGDTHYSWIEGSPALRRAIAERFQRLNGGR